MPVRWTGEDWNELHQYESPLMAEHRDSVACEARSIVS